MKRISLLALLISLVFLVSCTGNSSEEFDFGYDSAYEIDLSGLSFQFGSGWNTQLNPSEGFSSAGDKMRQRYRQLEAEYGCTFEVIAWEDGGNRILQHLAASMPIIDLLDSHARAGGYSLYKAGILASLEEISTIDYTDDKWGTMAFRQYGVFDGKFYGFYQWAWEFMPEFAGTMLFNNQLVKKLAVASPYEIQEAGNWDWETFKSYLQECLDSADPLLELKPVTAGSTFQDIQSFMFMNGCQFVNDDGAGNYSFGFDSPQGVQALEYLTDLMNSGLYFTTGQTPFSGDQNAVFFTCESFHGTHHQDGYTYPATIMEDLGMIVFPYGPSGNAELSSGFVHSGRRLNWVMAFSENDLDSIGIVMDYVFDYLDDSEGWRAYSESYIFHHQEAFENYCFMLDKINYNYSVQLSSSFSSIESALNGVVNGSRTASEAFDSIRDLVASDIAANIG